MRNAIYGWLVVGLIVYIGIGMLSPIARQLMGVSTVNFNSASILGTKALPYLFIMVMVLMAVHAHKTNGGV